MTKVTKSQRRRSATQKEQLKTIHQARGIHLQTPSIRNKENPPKEPAKSCLRNASEPVLRDTKNRLINTQRQVQYFKKKSNELREKATVWKEKAKDTWRRLTDSEMARITAVNTTKKTELALKTEKRSRYNLQQTFTKKHRAQREEVEKYKKRLKRADKVREGAVKKAESRGKALGQKLAKCPPLFKNHTYSVDARKMMRMLVQSGCARSKVGPILKQLAVQFGGTCGKIPSWRTVSRAVLEGYIAAKMRIAYEIKQSPCEYLFNLSINVSDRFVANTVSQDGTSNRGINFESMHINLRTADYKTGGLTINSNSTPKAHLVTVDSVVDQSADASIKAFVEHIEDANDTFNRSPLTQQLGRKVTIRDFFSALKGMHGDHASKEKSAARGLNKRKKQSQLEGLGEDALLTMDVHNLVQYLAYWNTKKIDCAGGLHQLNVLLPLEQAKCDKALMDKILNTLGRKEYEALSLEDQHELDLFIWAGCCMHKDQNSFQAGNKETMGGWESLDVPPPILLIKQMQWLFGNFLIPELQSLGMEL